MCCQFRETPRWRHLSILTVWLLAATSALAQIPDSERIELAPVAPVLEGLGGGGDFPVELILDDNTAEGVFGLVDASSRQFLWFNQFAVPPGPGFSLAEIQVLFPAGQDVEAGDAIQLVVYRDTDGDPTNGGELLQLIDETVQSVDGETFSRYSVSPPLSISAGGEVLIGVINRYYQTGIDPPDTLPAALDTSMSQNRSWLALWTGDPPEVPDLPADMAVVVLDGNISGNWMIRGFGTTLPAIEIPSLDAAGLAILTVLLALAGATALVRRRRAAVTVRRSAAGQGRETR